MDEFEAFNSGGVVRLREPLKLYRDPVPEKRSGRPPKYPFAQMKVGECFYVPESEVKSPNVLASSARQWAKRNKKNWKFVARQDGDMVGIWRLE